MQEQQAEPSQGRRVPITTHIALICSLLVNVLLVIQLERAKDVQEELDHQLTIQKQQKWLGQ